MMMLKIMFDSNRLHKDNLIMRGKEACHHRLLVLCYRGRICMGDNHILDLDT